MNELLASPMTAEAAWAVLDQVLDPEVPVLSVVELGIVREVRTDGDRVLVAVTPTYSGCPATEAIRDAIIAALQAAGAGPVEVRMQLAPAWTTDWIAPAAADKLRRYGIAPPHAAGAPLAAQPLRFHPRVSADPHDLSKLSPSPRLADDGARQTGAAIQCPRCDSTHTELLSAFGSTACKALYRCLACREPFDYFKPL